MAHVTDDQEGIRGVFERFVHSEVAGSVVMLACTLVALGWANSPWADAYVHLAHTQIAVSFGAASFSLSLQHWINEALMAVFFFVVGLEIKRELLVGQLSSLRQAALPVTAAIGGMLVPALLFAALNASGPGAAGWGVPMATDIAFALGVLSLFGRRVPLGLKVFLTALAIADDLGAVLVIAVFYTDRLHWTALGVAAICLVLMLLASRAGVRQPVVYIVLAIGVWADVLASGVHATVAGILVAMLVPIRARIEPARFLEGAEARLSELRQASLTPSSMIEDRTQLDAIDDIHEAAGDMRPAGLVLEEALHPVQAFFILPLFALFNAGVKIEGDFVAVLLRPTSLGIVLGLFLGKQIGIALFSWVAVRTGRAALPESVTWGQIYGVACLAGVGFTMSLFISELAFADPELVRTAKLGILAASLLSALWGFVVLQACLPARVEES